ncbi:hypothetical protein C3L33_05669, partial [Rhododendron williamsianum]
MVESLKFLPVQARIYEGNEPIQFFSIFQSFIVFKGGLSDGYKKHIAETELPDITYTEDGLALFRVQGSGPENMQAIQVEPVSPAYSLPSNFLSFPPSTEIYNFNQDDLMTEDIYILDCRSDIFIWVGQQVDSKTRIHALTIGEKPKRRTPVSYGGRSAVQINHSVPEACLSAPNEFSKVGFQIAAIAALTSTFDQPPRENIIPRSLKVSPEAPKENPETNSKENSMSSRIEALTIQEDVKEGEAEDEEGLPIYPYERLKISSTDPVTEIDVTKRETYLSSEEFREKFGMMKDAFYKLPKWKQNKLKMALQLF